MPRLLLPSTAILALCSAPAMAQSKLLVADATDYDISGHAVAVSGNIVVIGAPQDDDAGPGSGSATVFRWNGTAWIQEAKLVASDGAAYDRFGCAVAIAGDCIAVAARYADGTTPNCGAVYLYRFNTSIWAPEAKLVASDAGAFDEFGWSLSMHGDRVLVGSRFDDDRGFDAGAAYLFERGAGEAGAAWTQAAKFVAGDGGTYDQFGTSVALGEGVAVVGAPVDGPNGWGSGSAYVFRLSDAGWAEEAKLIASDASSSDEFGHAVAVDGSVIAIGAWGEDANGWDAGAAYVFRHDGSAWEEEQKLSPAGGVAGDLFGCAVAVRGGNVLVGAPFCDANGPVSGAAFRFVSTGFGWTQAETLTSTEDDAVVGFGSSVAIDNTAYVVGVPFDDDRGTESGCAYVFTLIDPLFADLNGDLRVDSLDLAILLGAWNVQGGPADLNGDGAVDPIDLGLMLGAWTNG